MILKIQSVNYYEHNGNYIYTNEPVGRQGVNYRRLLSGTNKNYKYQLMKPDVNNNKSLFSKNKDIELLAKFPWKNMSMKRNGNNVEPQKVSAMSDKSQLKTTASKNKLLAGICFVTDVKGFFKYVHPNFLKLFEGVDYQFFEKSIFDLNKPEDKLPTIDYLVEMIQEKRDSVFIENLFKNNQNTFSKLQWNISYYGGLLNFNLFEHPVSPEQEAISFESKPSKRKVLNSEIEKIYMNIEQVKTFHSGMIYP